jgi:CPA1 family monovalent cation:H+ antiporter
MTLFQLVALFLGLIGAAGWVNARLLHWPSATVMVIAGGLNAGLLLVLRHLSPHGGAGEVIEAVAAVNFPRTVLDYMLGFLLFAGAMQVDLKELRRHRLSIWTLATLGVLASTLIVGAGLWLAAPLVGLELGLPWAFVFGALISPTDPIAVLAAVRDGKLSKAMTVVLQGEALFNDGVGIVIFFSALAIAGSGAGLRPLEAVGQVALQAIGGLAFGLVTGWLAIRLIRMIDDYAVEVTLSLGLVACVYSVAQALDISGPIAVVAAGLLMGDSGLDSMSETTRRYVLGFWTLIDEILNAVLFMLLGIEVLVVPIDIRLTGLWAVAIVLVLVARFAVVLPWGTYFQIRAGERHAGLVLGWGGLHGALSLALALSIPRGPAQGLILSTTFAVVVFSVVVQGLTFGKVARWHADDPEPA